MFHRAIKQGIRIRLALIGPAGSGKTYSALAIAQHLGHRVALIDSERRSARKYAHLFTFDVAELTSYHPQRYIDAIQAAATAGYDVLVIDSLTHAYAGTDGVLQLVDKATKKTGNSFTAWRDVSPLHTQLIDAMLDAPLHLVVTLRAKMEYVMEKNERTGKTEVRKVGMQPIQRDGLEYEFDVVGDLTLDHELIITKSRCDPLSDQVFRKPGQEVADILLDWALGVQEQASPPTFIAPDPDPEPAPPAHAAEACAFVEEADTPERRAKLRVELRTAMTAARAAGVTLAPLDSRTVHAWNCARIQQEIDRTKRLITKLGTKAT